MKRDATDTKDDIQSLARAHSADAIAVLAEIMNNTDAPAGARLSAAKALLDRGWGKAGAKPPDDGNRARPVSQIKRVIVDPRHDDATRPSPSANVPMTNRAAAGRSSNLERGRLGFSYQRSELEKLIPLRAERRGSRPRGALSSAPRPYAAAMDYSSLSQVQHTCSCAFGAPLLPLRHGLRPTPPVAALLKERRVSVAGAVASLFTIIIVAFAYAIHFGMAPLAPRL